MKDLDFSPRVIEEIFQNCLWNYYFTTAAPRKCVDSTHEYGRELAASTINLRLVNESSRGRFPPHFHYSAPRSQIFYLLPSGQRRAGDSSGVDGDRRC
ncbi:hypothetical protein EVAR_14196_1 [Eumeta japonica]|uniref:Uncharacterized protein n=1 Tax=Eumeta variegata TaxID=151549 RepID=A0A4C1UEF4_EUMVA|nr:hypothetical protein EVAR_14196_1 [Eumeta japonica]